MEDRIDGIYSSAKLQFEEIPDGIKGDKTQQPEEKLLSLFSDNVATLRYKNRYEVRKQFSNVVGGYYDDFINQITKDLEYVECDNSFKWFDDMQDNINSPTDLIGEVWSTMIIQFTDRVVS